MYSSGRGEGTASLEEQAHHVNSDCILRESQPNKPLHTSHEKTESIQPRLEDTRMTLCFFPSETESLRQCSFQSLRYGICLSNLYTTM